MQTTNCFSLGLISLNTFVFYAFRHKNMFNDVFWIAYLYLEKHEFDLIYASHVWCMILIETKFDDDDLISETEETFGPNLRAIY